MAIAFQGKLFILFPSHKKNANVGFLGLSIFVVGIFMTFVVTVLAQTTPDIPDSNLAPVLNHDMPNVIPGQYIIVFKPDTDREVVMSAQEMAKSLGGTVEYTYTSALIGFSVKHLSASALRALRAVPGVIYIEADQKARLETIQPLNPIESIF